MRSGPGWQRSERAAATDVSEKSLCYRELHIEDGEMVWRNPGKDGSLLSILEAIGLSRRRHLVDACRRIRAREEGRCRSI
jgi:hypothetical protein